jgi:hypothetical protein
MPVVDNAEQQRQVGAPWGYLSGVNGGRLRQSDIILRQSDLFTLFVENLIVQDAF